MSNLEELIERLCPDGVEYKYLADVVTIKRGVRLIKKELKDNAKYPVYQNSLIPLGYYDDYNCEANKTMIITAGAAGDIVYSNTKFWAADDCFYFICNRYIDDKFLYYVLMSQQRGIYSKVRKASIPRLPRIVIEKIKLPVPPLEVQREIVRILDNFTFLTTELAAELAARQKQYEYYRDLLLTFKPNESTILNERTNELELSGTIRWIKLGDTCVLKAGKAISATEISQNVNDDYIYPCYGGNGLRGYVKNYNQDGEHPIVGRQGALCGNVCYACNKFYATEHAVVVSPSALYNEKFLYYLLDFARLEQYKTAGAQPGLSVARLEKVVLPVPPLEVQQRIVDILDRFDSLCNDISSGLPAEIEARQKQYEYYRDKLLTFKELKKEA